MERTRRTFTDIQTNEPFVLYTSNNGYKLISDGTDAIEKGTKVNAFYICTHCGVSLKINNSTIIDLQQGTFYSMKKGDVVTHKKYVGFKRFTKEK